MSKLKTNILLLLILISLLFPLGQVLAQATVDPTISLNEAAKQGGFKKTDIPTSLGNLAGAALAISGSIFLFLVIYGGMMIMTAAGKEQQLTKGKNIIIWAIIGAAVLGGAYAITQLVFSAFT